MSNLFNQEFVTLRNGGKNKRIRTGTTDRRKIMILTGAEIVVECLKEQGVDTVFGYPGGAMGSPALYEKLL